jgi:protein-L-isoaspartate(D-aspartate) O-methyltransferase
LIGSEVRTLATILGIVAMSAGWFGAQKPPTDRSTKARAEGLSRARADMVTRQIAARGVQDTSVLDAMRVVPRHLFVPEQYRGEAYEDYPLPIGEGQTISQPYIVGSMTEALELEPEDTVLEIGTGSGYQAAVLAEIASAVYTIEIIEVLGRRAESTLTSLHYDNVHVLVGDGYRGWPEHAPFDAIIVTAAPDHIPQPLVDQLAIGGRMVLPLGKHHQSLVALTKTPEGVVREDRFGVRFVPMTGEAEEGD